MKAFCIRVLKSISKKFEVIHYIGSDLDRCLFILNIEYIECRNIKKKGTNSLNDSLINY